MENYHKYFEQGHLVVQYLKNELTEQEKNDLDSWLEQSEHNRTLFKRLTDKNTLNSHLEKFSESGKDIAWKRIVEETGFKKVKNKPPALNFIKYAAAVLIILASGTAIYQFANKKNTAEQVVLNKSDLLPGGNKAVLTLSDGSKVTLDDAQNGEVAKQSGIIITKTTDGQLVYEVKTRGEEKASQVFNSINTPRGGQYQVILPDGTKVWLNAASSLKYPTTFSGNTRTVELKGEAYFEVAKNTAMPFIVKSANQTVEVLGTHFNINSYADEESIKTTLLEGSVKVTNYCTSGSTGQRLKPGQQSINTNKEINVINDADIEVAMAWKNGKFQFKDADLQIIMRQIARWYDVDVEFQGQISGRHYRGRISRNVPVSQIFQILKTSGVNFTIEGKKIIVKS